MDAATYSALLARAQFTAIAFLLGTSSSIAALAICAIYLGGAAHTGVAVDWSMPGRLIAVSAALAIPAVAARETASAALRTGKGFYMTASSILSAATLVFCFLALLGLASLSGR